MSVDESDSKNVPDSETNTMETKKQRKEQRMIQRKELEERLRELIKLQEMDDLGELEDLEEKQLEKELCNKESIPSIE